MAAAQNTSVLPEPQGSQVQSEGDGGCWLPEELTIEILKRLPTARCIGRFRCVNKSWKHKLSDVNFIRKILFPGDEEKEAAKVMVTGVLKNQKAGDDRLAYSVLSCQTLQPVSSGFLFTDLVSRPKLAAGCCNGMFCLYETVYVDRRCRYEIRFMLWNPTTSETKLLPSIASRSGIKPPLTNEAMVSFGFDHQTNDYKVGVISIDRETSTNIACIYSLKNDSWGRLNIHSADLHLYRKVNQLSHPGSYHKVYWRSFGCHKGICISWFDMTKDEFKNVICIYEDWVRSELRFESCSVVKESLIAIFRDYRKKSPPLYEIWGVLDYELGDESSNWIKLFTVSHLPALWEFGKCFAVHSTSDDDYKDSAATVGSENAAEDGFDVNIQAKFTNYDVATYLPSNISLSSSSSSSSSTHVG